LPSVIKIFAVLVELEDFLSEHDAGGIARRHTEYGGLVVDIGGPQITVPGTAKPCGKRAQGIVLWWVDCLVSHPTPN
jgi:hypothetical protein